MRLVRFGEYQFPEDQIELSDNFRDLVPRTIRLPGMSGGYRVYGDNPSPSEVGNVRTAFWLMPEDHADLQDMIDAVGKLRTFGVQRLYAKLRNSNIERWCWAEVNNIQISENVQNVPHKRQRVAINFQVEDPFWHTDGKESPVTWGSFNWGDDGVDFGSTGISNAVSGLTTTFAVNNAGNAETYPRIIIETGEGETAQNVRVQRIVGGNVVDEVRWNATLAAESTLEINCRAASVRLNNANAYGANFTFLNGNFFRLPPGDSNIRVLMAASGNAASIKFFYYERYT